MGVTIHFPDIIETENTLNIVKHIPVQTGAGEAIVGDFVSVIDGKIVPAKADALSTLPCIGVLVEKVDSENTTIINHGIVDMTGLTAGANYYISDIDAGKITTVVPATFVQKIGKSISSTKLWLDIDNTIFRKEV